MERGFHLSLVSRGSLPTRPFPMPVSIKNVAKVLNKVVSMINFTRLTLFPLTRFFQNYHHPAFKAPSLWDPKYISHLKKFLYVVKDDKKRALVNEVLAAFNDVVVPVMDKLAQGM